MIRKSIIKKNINTSEIHHVIGHNGSVFLKLFFKYFLFLSILLLLFLLLDNYVIWEYLNWVFAWVGFLFFVKFCIDFFNIYLDSLVMTNEWIVLYLWEWLLEYKTESFDWHRIETVSHNQNGIWDKIFLRGDIMIRLEHWVEFPFEKISYPKKQATKILQLKSLFLSKNNLEISSWDDDKRFDVLVEALWEVVKDYIDKKSLNEDIYQDDDFDEYDD